MTSPRKPLDGTAIVDLSVNLPGPLASAGLRDLGARVTRVVPPTGDPLSGHAPKWHRELAAGKQARQLDLKDPAGSAQLAKLLAETDLLLTSSRPAALRRLGLAWSDLHARYPRLCQVAIVGYPAPDEDRPGHDLTYQAEAGLCMPPGMPRTLLADLAGAERAVSAALALLLHRERTGEADYASVSLAAAATHFAAPLRHGLTAGQGPLSGVHAPYAIYATSDGWIALAALEPRLWDNVARMAREQASVQLAVPADRPARDALIALFRTRSTAAWLTLAQDYDLPLAALPPEG